MAKYPYAKLIWNKDVLEILGFTDGLDYAFAKYLKNLFKPYVPYHTGELSRSTRIVKDNLNGGYNIVYDAPYASAQYEGSNGSGMPEWLWERDRSVHGLATSYWDKWAVMDHEDEIVSIVDNERKRRCK